MNRTSLLKADSRRLKAPERSEGINRLLDIVVEEVSLVDRAANKHRFLIVKRSDEMDETTTDTTTSPADETTAETNPAPAPDSEAGGADEGAGGGGEPTGGATESAPLAVAVAALEGLTETVELLGTLGEEEAKPRLAELATELRGVSERLWAACRPPGVSAQPSAVSEGVPSAGELMADGRMLTAGERSEPGAAFASVIEAVRATLQRVEAACRPPGVSGQPSAVSEGAPSAGQLIADGRTLTAGEQSEPSDGGLGDQLAELATELRALTDTVKEQQQRLARLEKRFGLPNSAPSGERPPRADDEDVGWPMDLNRPFDRESVDKAISFHEL